MINLISPFKVIVSDNNYIINGGKVINYFNPLNYRRVRKDFNEDEIPYIDDNLTEEHIYEFGATTVYIEIFLMASFKAPQFWVPGHNFLPIIDNVWIVRKEYDNASGSTLFGSLVNSSPLHMRFDTVPQLPFGYACNLTCVATIALLDGQFVVDQSLNDNFIFSRLFDSRSYGACNNIIDTDKSKMLTAFGQVYNDQNSVIYRGNLETIIGFGLGLDDLLSSNAVQPIGGAFLESQIPDDRV